MSNKKISLIDIARLSGVSTATVSRVINNNGRFSEETGERVRKIIEEYGYVPNTLARSLRTNRSQVVGILVPDITNEFFATIAQKIQMELLKHDYSSMICNTDESKEVEIEHLNILRAQLVSGLIYISGSSTMDKELKNNIPTVYIDRKPHFEDGYQYAYITSDNKKGGYLATKELIDAGCRKIAIVRFERKISSYEERYEGYKKALKDFNIKSEAEQIIFVDKVSINRGYDIMKNTYENNLDIDGVFFTTDVLAIGALNYLNEMQINVPKELKIVGFDNISLSNITYPKLTTVNQRVDEIAETSVSLLKSMIETDEEVRIEKEIDVELVKRSTT